jgi:hypothetical protein
MVEWQTTINCDAGYVAGIKVERERIIKLLKKNLKTAQGLMGQSMNTALTESYIHGLEQSIALIKGENK